MYCTGGIRCERASALMDTLARTSDGAFEPADVVMVRGGIERYMKTFPEGGFWKGKNYLFDHRQEQRPEAKSDEALARDIESHCASCHAPCATYRGTFKCAGVLPPPVGNCGVPVIVCARCARSSSLDASRSLYCPLCEEGYVPPSAKPDILLAKRKLADRGEGPAEANVGSGGGGEVGGGGGAEGRSPPPGAMAPRAPSAPGGRRAPRVRFRRRGSSSAICRLRRARASCGRRCRPPSIGAPWERTAARAAAGASALVVKAGPSRRLMLPAAAAAARRLWPAATRRPERTEHRLADRSADGPLLRLGVCADEQHRDRPGGGGVRVATGRAQRVHQGAGQEGL